MGFLDGDGNLSLAELEAKHNAGITKAKEKLPEPKRVVVNEVVPRKQDDITETKNDSLFFIRFSRPVKK